MMDWPAVLPPPAVATAMMRIAQPALANRVAAPADSGNDTDNRHKPPDSHMRHPVVVPPRPDADRPTGPPPAFEANVLEAETERRLQRMGKAENRANAAAPISGEAEGGPVSQAPPNGADDASQPSKTDRPAARYYSELSDSVEPQIDLMR